MPSKVVPANETITYKIYHLGRVAPSALDFMENYSPFFWSQKGSVGRHNKLYFLFISTYEYSN